MGRKSISRALLVKFLLLSFTILITSGCSADTHGSSGSIYTDYGNLIKKSGKKIESMATFLGANTKNIVECSSDKRYVSKLMSMERDFETVIKEMSEIEVPAMALQYHNQIKQALIEYHEMLTLLLRSSNAKSNDEKKEFLDKAALKVQKANEIASKANENILTVNDILKKYQK